jgi:hypothetical protein
LVANSTLGFDVVTESFSKVHPNTAGYFTAPDTSVVLDCLTIYPALQRRIDSFTVDLREKMLHLLNQWTSTRMYNREKLSIIKLLPLFERHQFSLMQLASSALQKSQNLYPPDSIALVKGVVPFSDVSNARFTSLLSGGPWYFLDESSPSAAVSANILRFNASYNNLYEVRTHLFYCSFLSFWKSKNLLL